jgi:CubicO group peptidase (beta-lactamase class C family)
VSALRNTRGEYDLPHVVPALPPLPILPMKMEFHNRSRISRCLHPLLMGMLVTVAGCGPDASEHPSHDRKGGASIEPGMVNGIGGSPPLSTGLDPELIDEALTRAAGLPRLRCLLVARHGEVLTERCVNGADPDRPANIKSVSKSVLSALVGLAIDGGDLEGPDQPVVPFFAGHLGGDIDPRRDAITVGNLLSMQAGLERTSGGNYGRWVTSRNWVRHAITRPMVADPGGPMLYSTGSSHLLSAILTEATGASTLRFARERLAGPLGIDLPAWPADPQGVFFGGNEMRMSPRALVRFGELYRNDGMHDGERVLSAEWIRTSLEPRTRSRWSGDGYGYGWFLSNVAGHLMFYGWGYGGQYLFVIPDLELTVVVTSDPDPPSDRGHRKAIRDLLEETLVPAAVKGE